ncbi:MAG TPA: spore germination protein [Bacillota bacterium]|nr:spore germination protein [Bacillota bacterium]
MSLLKNIMGFFQYKESPYVEQFELLEEDTEGIDLAAKREEENKQETTTDKQRITTDKQEPKNKKGKKPTLNVDEWNAARKQDSGTDPLSADNISLVLMQNRQRIEQEFNMPKNKDVIIRDIRIGKDTEAFIVFVEGMADSTTIKDFILRPLMTDNHFENSGNECDINYIMENVLSANQVDKASTYDEVISQVLNGLTALFIQDCHEGILIESRGFEKRSVEQPVTETVISGPHEAFTENLRTNLTLVRKIIKNKNLITEMLPIGKTNNSDCGIMYIDGIANTKIVDEVKRRIKSIDIDFIMGSGMLNQLIEDHPLAIFPQILTTERPDRTASFLMEGKVIFICDGTPYASAVPVTFFHMFHSSEDSFMRWQYGTFIRLIRVMAFFLAMFLPGFFIALTLYHAEMVPTELLLAIERSRENVPFPVIAEILMMEVAFELIREAGIRVPDVIGHTLGIIGALILGQSAVAANLVSPLLVIIVSITGLGNFAMPNYYLGVAIRILKFLFIFLGFFAGFYGISIGIFIIGGMACSMKCFGVPYFAPVAPKTKVNPDVIIRQPIWKQRMRPDLLNSPNQKRAGNTVRGWAYKDKKGNRK